MDYYPAFIIIAGILSYILYRIERINDKVDKLYILLAKYIDNGDKENE